MPQSIMRNFRYAAQGGNNDLLLPPHGFYTDNVGTYRSRSMVSNEFGPFSL